MLLDVTLISGARPFLLSKTLSSFQEKLFRHFEIGRCYANIDLFGGGEAERIECRDIILRYFPSAQISAPGTPGFGRAVKTVWAQAQAPLVFHLEDDWIALEDILPEEIEPHFCGITRAVTPLTAQIRWNGRDQFLTAKRKKKWMGIVWSRSKVNAFGTCPGFFDGEFVRTCAGLLDPDLDPEKQMSPQYNPALMAYMDQFRCRLLPGRNQSELIRDIGRDWRQERGIVKVVSQGRSVWTHATQERGLASPEVA